MIRVGKPLVIKIVSLFLVWERGGGTPSQRKMYVLLLGRKVEERGFLLCLLFLNCLQIKIILMPK